MKHIKPPMSWATDQNHLNEQLAKYWQREYEELEADHVSLKELRDAVRGLARDKKHNTNMGQHS